MLCWETLSEAVVKSFWCTTHSFINQYQSIRAWRWRKYSQQRQHGRYRGRNEASSLPPKNSADVSGDVLREEWEADVLLCSVVNTEERKCAMICALATFETHFWVYVGS